MQSHNWLIIDSKVQSDVIIKSDVICGRNDESFLIKNWKFLLIIISNEHGQRNEKKNIKFVSLWINVVTFSVYGIVVYC